MGRGERRVGQDPGPDRARGPPAAGRGGSGAHPLSHLHQGRRGRNAGAPVRAARRLVDAAGRDPGPDAGRAFGRGAGALGGASGGGAAPVRAGAGDAGRAEDSDHSRLLRRPASALSLGSRTRAGVRSARRAPRRPDAEGGSRPAGGEGGAGVRPRLRRRGEAPERRRDRQTDPCRPRAQARVSRGRGCGRIAPAAFWRGGGSVPRGLGERPSCALGSRREADGEGVRDGIENRRGDGRRFFQRPALVAGRPAPRRRKVDPGNPCAVRRPQGPAALRQAHEKTVRRPSRTRRAVSGGRGGGAGAERRSGRP